MAHSTARNQRRGRARHALVCALLLITVGVVASSTARGSTVTRGIFSDHLAPQTLVDPDRRAVELGVKFSPQRSGQVRALQYYQSPQASGVTQATLWSSRGKILARVHFKASHKVGWRTVRLSSPVHLVAGRTYVASYHAPRGGYSSVGQDFTSKRTQHGFVLPRGAGVYAYGAAIAFPTSTWRATNYLVDVVYRPSRSNAPPPPTTSPSPTSPSSGRVVLGRTFPSAETTGVPPGTDLQPYDGPCSIVKDNIRIDRMIVNCDLRILSQGVTITNSIVNGTVYSDPDYFNGSFTLSDSEIRMPQAAGTGVGDVNFVVTRVEVTGGSRSINCAANCTVQDSYLHGQYTDDRGIDHESAVRMGAESVIRHNTITCDATPVPPDAGCSAALTGYGDFAVVQKNTIRDNLIDGGPFGSMGYCAYGGSTPGKPFSEGVNNIKFINNIFMRGANGKCGIWGPITSFDSRAPGNVWSNNLWNDGARVRPAN